MKDRIRLAMMVPLLTAACSEGAALIGEVRPRPPSSTTPAPRDLDAGSVPDASIWSGRFECRTTDDVHTKILRPKCGVCHGPDQPQSNLDLLAPGVRQRLLDGRSVCQGRPFVTFDNGYVRGHLFDKLAGAVPGCGNQMPFGAIGPLVDAEVDCLRAWFRGDLPGGEPVPPPPDLDAGAPDLRDAWVPPQERCEPAEIPAKILQPKCGICHGPDQPASDLDLLTPGVRQRLLDGRSVCGVRRPFVTIDNGNVSGHLFDKLAGAVPGCGNQMPFGGIAPLRPAEIDCLRAWFQPGPP